MILIMRIEENGIEDIMYYGVIFTCLHVEITYVVVK